MIQNDFKNNLKVSIKNPTTQNNNEISDIDSLLKQLGLFPLPENVQATLSEDNEYLNIRLKDTDTEKHLLFQFKLKENDLSNLESREDYKTLLNRYSHYINHYINEIKKYAMQESIYLHEKFPNTIFNIKIRIKSFDSYVNKLSQNISENKNPYINDIMAERLVIAEHNGSQDEKTLKKMCYRFAKALYDFRINTDFRMKKVIECNEAETDEDSISKDYIAHPKSSGYESLHILVENLNNPDFTYETQIRTLQMEEMSKNSNEIAHCKYKPRVLNDLSPNKVPMYSEITCFRDKFGNPIIIDVPFDERFYHFYNAETIYHSNLKESFPPITLKRFMEEQYKIENTIGMSFREIRFKLRQMNKELDSEHELR